MMIHHKKKTKALTMKAHGFHERVIAHDTGLTVQQIRRLINAEPSARAKRQRRKQKAQTPDSRAAWKLLREGNALKNIEKMFPLTDLQRRKMAQHEAAIALTLPQSTPIVNVAASELP